MSDIDPFISLADRTIGLEEEVKNLKVLSARPYVICKQAQEIRVFPEPGTEPASEEREDDVLYFCKIEGSEEPEEPGEMVLVCNIPSANYKLDLSPWLSAAPGDGTTDISIDWGDNASAVSYVLNSLERPSVSKKFEVYTVEEREDEPVIEEDERFIEGENQIATLATDYPVEETSPETGTITHTYAAAGEYRITLKGSFKWGLGTYYIFDNPLKPALTAIELPSGKSPIKYVSFYAFYRCSALTSIPAGLFDNCTAMTDFYGCFQYCSALTSIPAGLFDNCTAVTDFSYCFAYCSALTSIPEGLFDNCTAVTDIKGCFGGCTALTSIPAGLFDNCTAVTDFYSCFYNCSALTSIPEGLFDNCTAVTSFGWCFSGCSALTSIPQGLFDNCTAVTNFYRCFYNCSKLTSIPQGLFDKCTKVTDFSWCFLNCSALTSIPAGLFDKCTAVTDFGACFSGCTALTSIPQGLFDKCTAVKSFTSCFYNCSKLTSALPTLWISHKSALHDSCFYNCTKATNYAAAKSAGWA